MAESHKASGFVVYEPQKRPKKLAADEVSLSKTNILLSEELAKQLADGCKLVKVVLLYSREARQIGIRKAGHLENAYRLSGRSVPSRSFYEHFNITERGRFRAALDMDGVLVIPLSQG